MRLFPDAVSTGVSSLDFCNHPTVQHWQLKRVWAQPEDAAMSDPHQMLHLTGGETEAQGNLDSPSTERQLENGRALSGIDLSPRQVRNGLPLPLP